MGFWRLGHDLEAGGWAQHGQRWGEGLPQQRCLSVRLVFLGLVGSLIPEAFTRQGLLPENGVLTGSAQEPAGEIPWHSSHDDSMASFGHKIRSGLVCLSRVGFVFPVYTGAKPYSSDSPQSLRTSPTTSQVKPQCQRKLLLFSPASTSLVLLKKGLSSWLHIQSFTRIPLILQTSLPCSSYLGQFSLLPCQFKAHLNKASDT